MALCQNCLCELVVIPDGEIYRVLCHGCGYEGFIAPENLLEP